MLGLAPRIWIYLLVNVILVLLGGLLATNLPEPLGVGIGIGLVVTGVAGTISFLYVFVSDRWMERIQILSDFGLTGVHAERGPQLREHYAARLARATRSIDVLGFGLRSLRLDFQRDFESWASRANVRILLIDPTYPTQAHAYADQRDREELDTPGTISRDVRDFTESVKNVAGRYPDRFAVRLYRCLPAVTIFRIDNEIYWGPYLVKTPSRNLPVFVARRGGLLFERLEAHFEEVWNDDRLSVPMGAASMIPKPASTPTSPEVGRPAQDRGKS